MGLSVKEGKGKSTICWECKHCMPCKGNPCSWASRFEPVEGWDALRTELKISESKTKDTTESYRVIECPLFLRG